MKGLTKKQSEVMLVLKKGFKRERNFCRMSLDELSEFSKIPRSTIIARLNAMEKKGYIIRRGHRSIEILEGK